jgi:hypothetical protein
VQRASRKRHLKGATDIETSSPSARIAASAQYSCSEVTRHHDGLTHRGLLRCSPLRLASQERAMCPRSLHLHMVL